MHLLHLQRFVTNFTIVALMSYLFSQPRLSARSTLLVALLSASVIYAISRLLQRCRQKKHKKMVMKYIKATPPTTKVVRVQVKTTPTKYHNRQPTYYTATGV